MRNDAATLDLQGRGRLSQRCPTCGIVEAAGWYCTADGTPTGPADWSPRELSLAARAKFASVGRYRTLSAEIPHRPDVDTVPTLGLIDSPVTPAA